MIPALANEVDFSRGATKSSKADVEYKFKNGSTIDILAARESSRGQRRTGGIIEEVILVDQDALNEIVIPTMNVDRTLPDGHTTDPDEVVNQSQVYITTAGYKQTFAYDKLIEFLISSIVFPNDYFIMGSDYTLSILEGAVKETMIEDMKIAGTYNENSFDREFGSHWSGDTENAYFSIDTFERGRILNLPEYEATSRSKSAYYIIGVDVGRLGCNSEAVILKVTPQPQADALKSVVNIYSLKDATMEEQSVWIKRMYYKYKPRSVVIDANGIGVNLIDEMVRPTLDPETGETYPPFGVEGGTYDGAGNEYKRFKTDDMIKNAMFLIKANAPFNTESYSYLQTQLSSNKVKFLIDEQTARAKLLETKKGQKMTPRERNEYLWPYEQTSSLREQLGNLVESNEGVNIILKQANRSVLKDKFSAFQYAMYYAKREDTLKKKRRSFNIADLLLVN